MKRRGDPAPQLEFVPLFRTVMQEPWCTRPMAAVYGAIAAFHAVGYHPTVRELAYAAGLPHRVRAHEALIELGKRNLIRRNRITMNRTEYELLGPRLMRS